MVVSRFMTSTEVKDKIGGMIGNIDDSALSSTILRAQDFYIEEVLNYKSCGFYYELMEKNEAGTLNAYEEELVEYYIKPALAEWVYYMSMEELSYRLSNKGVIEETSINTQNVDKDKFVLKGYGVKAMAIKYMDRLKKYLCENTTYFPNYLYPIDFKGGYDAGDNTEIYLGPY